PDGSDWPCDHHPRQRCHRRLGHIDHERALEHHRIGTMTSLVHSLSPHRLRSLVAAAHPGYTLIEMLVVLTIISLILGLIGPRVLSYLSESRVKTAKVQIESFSSALDLFSLDTGRSPTSSEGLDALTQRPAGISVWNGPYLKNGRVPNDPWGN